MYCDVVGSTELSRVRLAGGLPRPDGGLPRRLRRRDRAALRGPHRPLQGRRRAVGLRLSGRARERRRAGRARGAGAGAGRRRAPRSAETGAPLAIRVGVHNGTVYRKLDEDEILGFATNIGARYETLAAPGTVVVSDEVRQLVEAHFELEAGEPAARQGHAGAAAAVPRHQRAPRAPAARLAGAADRPRGRARAPCARALAADADGRAGARRGEPGVGKSRLAAALTDELDTVRAARLAVPRRRRAASRPRAARAALRPAADASRGASGSPTSPPRSRAWGSTPPPSRCWRPCSARARRRLRARPRPRAAARGPGQPDASRPTLKACAAAAARGRGPALVRRRHARAAGADRARPARFVVATSRHREPGQLGDDRAAAARRSTDRLALIDALALDLPRLGSALAARSDGIPLYVEELVRARAARGRARATRPVPGSVPAALYEPLVARLYATPDGAAAWPRPPPPRASRRPLAAGGDDGAGRRRARRDARTRSWPRASSSRSTTPASASATSCCARSPTSCSRRRGGAWSTAGSATSCSPRRARRLARRRRRTSSAPSATTKRRTRTCNAAEWARRRGALDEARAQLTRAIELVDAVPATTRRPREVQLRLRRGLLAMSAEGAGSADASADFDRCLELAAADPHGDELFSTLIALWAYYLSRAELGRAREVSVTLRDALAGERDVLHAPEPRGVRDDRLVRRRLRGRREQLDQATREVAPRRRGRRRLVRAQRPGACDARPPRARALHGRRRRRRRAELDQRRAVAAPLDFPHGPWSMAYAIWLSSWLWIETGATRASPTSRRRPSRRAPRHGFDGWALIATTQRAALEALRGAARRRPRRGHAGRARRDAGADPRALGDARAADLPPLLPDDAPARCSRRAGDPAARARATRSRCAGRRDRHALLRRRDAAPARRAPSRRRGRALEAALELARRQGARPFELRIALDLGDRGADRAGGRGLRRARPQRRSRHAPGDRAPRRHPRRRHGRAGDRLAPERARLARRARLDHRLPARLAARRQGRQQPRRRTAASRSTGCTSGSATTRTPSACCASATPSSTGRRPTRRRRSGRGARRSSRRDRRAGGPPRRRLAPLARPVHPNDRCPASRTPPAEFTARRLRCAARSG